MKLERRLYITGDISFDAYEAFSKQLRVLELRSTKSVIVELASDGGDAHAALAFSSRIRMSHCNITILAMGNVASAAVLILASGHHRIMAKEAWVMVHEDSATHEGTITALEREAKQCRRLEDQWNALMEKYTTTSKELWAHMHKATTYLDAKECLVFDLIDEVR